jgi:glycosyltransferase involved in cell wall biosynthesis
LHILVFHQYYLGPGEPGGSRFNEFARMWSAAGHKVTIVAGTLNYTTGQAASKYRGRWNVRESDGDVVVWRCHVPATYAKGYAGRMWAFFGFTLSALTAAFRAARPDVVIASSPPLITAIPAYAAAKRFSVPWLFEIRDLWPESVVEMGAIRRGSLLARLLFALEKWAYRAAARVNVLTPAFRDNILKRRIIPEEKLVFIPNGADVRLFFPGSRDNAVRRELGWGDRTVVLYTGAHGRTNRLGQLIDTARMLSSRPDILIACVGDGPDRVELQARAEREGLRNIRFYGPQPKEAMPDFVNAADIGAAVLGDDPIFHLVYPNKVFDYMACERPTLLAIDGVARNLVCDQAQAGVFVQPENAADIARGIERLADDAALRAELGRNGRQWVLTHATRDALSKRYLEVLSNLLTKRHSP